MTQMDNLKKEMDKLKQECSELIRKIKEKELSTREVLLHWKEMELINKIDISYVNKIGDTDDIELNIKITFEDNSALYFEIPVSSKIDIKVTH